jgi:hypothetical protein
MSRPIRIEYAEAVYHVTSRGNAMRSIFEDDKDRWMLLNILEEVNDRYHWLCHAYCLMNITLSPGDRNTGCKPLKRDAAVKRYLYHAL